VNITTGQFFLIKNKNQFNYAALAVFKHQAKNCAVYREYLSHLKINAHNIKKVTDIPFLPIAFFKTHQIISNTNKPAIVFSSSGTTGANTSKHFVTDINVYKQSYSLAFNQFYGNINNTCILALLPNYLEREGSSLIYMVNDLLTQTKNPNSGYFLQDFAKLHTTLQTLQKAKQKTILIGVTYALLDFIEKFELNFPELIVMETGGMKGKRKEMVRAELHQNLKAGFGVKNIHSEYGMTELLSQAYSAGNGLFKCPNWMQIDIRDTNDPLTLLPKKQAGGINVIDLANVNSCSFIATQDLGKCYPNGSFEVLGRFDDADIRGCNLLVQ
jgi:phenylacetate-coenzyme A ligase PaaK-like adenylate-forming protein